VPDASVRLATDPVQHAFHYPGRTQAPGRVRMGGRTLGAHGVASSSNSARPAYFVGGVLNAVAPRIAQHVIEIRSAHRNFGAHQPGQGEARGVRPRTTLSSKRRIPRN